MAETLNENLERFWKGLADGHRRADLTRYDDVRRQARALGYEYVPNGELIAFLQEKRLERLEALVAKGLTNDAGARQA